MLIFINVSLVWNLKIEIYPCGKKNKLINSDSSFLFYSYLLLNTLVKCFVTNILKKLV